VGRGRVDRVEFSRGRGLVVLVARGRGLRRRRAEMKRFRNARRLATEGIGARPYG